MGISTYLGVLPIRGQSLSVCGNNQAAAGHLMTLCLSSQLAIAEDEESPKDDIAAHV